MRTILVFECNERESKYTDSINTVMTVDRRSSGLYVKYKMKVNGDSKCKQIVSIGTQYSKEYDLLD